MKKTKLISRKKAVSIVAAHNRIPVDVAERYTKSELRETLKQAGFRNIEIEE